MNWAPGTVIADGDGSVFFIVARPRVSAVDADGNGWRVASIEGARPLVVLDLSAAPPDNNCSTQQTLRDATLVSGPNEGKVLRWLADQIEAQTKPPKPAEPRGRFAVVRDRNDSLWVRLNQTHWYSEASPNNNQTYGEIDAVEVVREGLPQ